MSNGLKLMVLTTKGRILLTEGLNFISIQDIYSVVSNNDNALENKYLFEQFSFERVYPVNGTIAVEFNSKHGINLLKNHNLQEKQNDAEDQ